MLGDEPVFPHFHRRDHLSAANWETIMKKRKPLGESLFHRIATFIVDKRHLFFVLYLFAIVFCLFSMKWVVVENDITNYLPEDTETRQGLVTMNENFAPVATARVMVSNISYETAQDLNDTLSQIDGIEMVLFDDSADHYRDAAALYDITLSAGNNDPVSLQAMAQVRNALADYDTSIDTLVGYDDKVMLQEEMTTILIIAVFIILIVLTLTSRSYAEVLVLLLTFGVAAILNMGTNFMFDKISFISDSVAVVLQLALAIDYAIILCHRFSDERETKDARQACIDALAKSIPEIGASSLTTISGLAALAFMKFSIGMDMSMVLIKSILLSLLSVFTLMPGLLILFTPLIDRTRHRRLLPQVSFLGRFAHAARRVVPLIFVVVLGGAFWLSNRCPYCYSFTDVRTAKMDARQEAYFDIKEVFGTNNMVALVVPSGNYEGEKAILQELEQQPQVKSTMGLAYMEAMDGYCLTDSLTPRQFSELLDMDYEVAQVLYSAYAAEHDQYGQILSGLNEYKIPLFDLFIFLKDQMQSHNIVLEGADQEMMDDLFAQLETAQQQMRSEKYSRMLIYLNLPEEGQATYDFLDQIRAIAGRHYDGDYYVVGNSTSSRDLSSSFASDNLMISILSALFVILVLLFTFRSAALPVLLIVVIQGSIWINFSFPTLMQQPLYFLGYLIVSAIQMGANIDYAIVISSHYQEKRTVMGKKDAIIQALNAAFPTVFTSGSIMAAAGLLIGNLSAQPVVSIMGTCLGRGTIISILLVLGVLPAFLVLGDTLIDRTRFHISMPQTPKTVSSGSRRLSGHVRGYMSGMVDADFNGTLHGDVDASISGEVPAESNQGGADHE